jgi:hypothetical protein
MTKPVKPQQITPSLKRAAIALSAALILFCSMLWLSKIVVPAFAPHDADKYARSFIESLRTGNFDEARRQLDVSLRGEETDKGIRAVHDLFSKGGSLLEINLITFKTISSTDKPRTDLYYQLHFQGYWAGGEVDVGAKDGTYSVLAIRFRQIPDSEVEMYRFSLLGKSAFHYVILACCIIIPVFILYTLVVCISTRIRWKWLWIVFILCGLTHFIFDWSTGDWDVKFASVVLFGSDFTTGGPETSWILGFGLPFGAIFFWIYEMNRTELPKSGRKRRNKRAGG